MLLAYYPNRPFSIVTLILLATTVAGTPKDELTDIIHGLTFGTRSVLAVSKFSTSLILLVSGVGGLDDLRDGYVFDQDAKTLHNSNIELHQPMRVIDKWPLLEEQPGSMIIVNASAVPYIVIFDSQTTHAININTGLLDNIPKSATFQDLIFQSKLISTNEPGAFFSFNYGEAGHLLKFQFYPPNQIQKGGIVLKYDYTVCNLGQKKIIIYRTIDAASCIRVYWNIQSGFVNEQTVVLFEKDNSIITFSIFALNLNKPVKITRIKSVDFWIRWKPPTEPPTTKAKVIRRNTPSPRTGLAIYLCIAILIVLFSGALLIIFFCKRGQPKKSITSPKDSPQPKIAPSPTIETGPCVRPTLDKIKAKSSKDQQSECRKQSTQAKTKTNLSASKASKARTSRGSRNRATTTSTRKRSSKRRSSRKRSTKITRGSMR